MGIAEVAAGFGQAAQACTFTLVPLLIVGFFVWPYSARPGCPIKKLGVPSTMIMPAWLLMAGCFYGAYFTAPNAPVASSAAAPVEFSASNKKFFLGFLVRGIVFTVLHIFLTFVRLGLRATVTKWQGILICEVAKTVTVVAIITGMMSLDTTGDLDTSSACFMFMVALLVILVSVSVARLTAVIKVARLPQGLTAENFNSYYFGTDPSCPVTPYLGSRFFGGLFGPLECEADPAGRNDDAVRLEL